MRPAPSPPNEIDRIRALRETCVLDTAPEVDFDDLTRLAAYLCDTPMALVSLVDESRQWFKSSVGVSVSGTPRSIAFCGHAILSLDPLVVHDATQDERFLDNPLVTGEPHVRFYAGAPLLTPDGFALGTLCVIDTKPRAISELQLEHLCRLARQASSLLEMRRMTRGLAKQKFRAEAANRDKGRFLINLSHEIRRPLTALLGFAELLQHNEDVTHAPPHVGEFVGAIRESGQDMLRILDDVLDLSQIESGNLEIHPDSIPTQPFLMGIAAIWKRRAHDKGLDFQLHTSADVPDSIRSDPRRLQQIIVNLLSNAVKFTESGFVRLEVSYVGVRRRLLRLDVVDSGIGIDPARQQCMFKRFTQADYPITRQFGGTCLGLTISKRLAELLGGDVSLVSSTVGTGSRFRLELNTAILDVRDSDDPSDSDAAPSETETDLDGIRILVAVDNAYNSKLLELILEPKGAEIEQAKNGMGACAKAQEAAAGGTPYDLILMDLQVPDMDGLASARELRNKGYDGTIIAVAAHAQPDDRRKCLNAGFDDYLTKPFSSNQLLTMCAKWLNKQAPALSR